MSARRHNGARGPRRFRVEYQERQYDGTYKRRVKAFSGPSARDDEAAYLRKVEWVKAGTVTTFEAEYVTRPI